MNKPLENIVAILDTKLTRANSNISILNDRLELVVNTVDKLLEILSERGSS